MKISPSPIVPMVVLYSQSFGSFNRFYLQGLQIAFLRVTEQGGDAMIVSHTPNIGVSPQWEDLTNDGHPPQGAVNQLHDICITHLLKMKKTGGD